MVEEVDLVDTADIEDRIRRGACIVWAVRKHICDRRLGLNDGIEYTCALDEWRLFR